MVRVWTLAFCLVFALQPSFSEAKIPADYSDLLSRDVVGANAIRKTKPSLDGRNVVVAILDTGVDPTVPGLQITPDNRPKLIAARDFSDQDLVSLNRAQVETSDTFAMVRHGDHTVRVNGNHLSKAIDGRVWLGSYKEASLQGAGGTDMDGNGSTDDHFLFVVFRDKDVPGQDGWRILVDADQNGQMEGPGSRPFNATGDILLLGDGKPGRTNVQIPVMAYIRPAGPTLELHMASGSHGTHVAAIAAGHRLMARDGFDGIAPGSQIISLKIGDTSLSGGASTTNAKKRALEYAAQWSQVHDVAVVANISYGIGSETEGRHEIETFVDDLLRRTPRLSVVVSGGNSGPGLSTIGTPAGSLLVTTAAAGYTQTQTGPLLRKQRRSGNQTFFFSSRGGELAKPDILTPGIAFASVPDYDAFPIKAGTSMAAPLAAGLTSLMWDHAHRSKYTLHHGDVKAALIASARPLKGQLHLDQGAGIPNLSRALRQLDRLARSKRPRPLALSVSVEDRRHPDNPTSAFFWRLHARPEASDLFQLKVTAVLPDWWTPEERTRYFSRVKWSGQPGWITTQRKSAGIKGTEPVSFGFRVPRTPGKKQGLVEATTVLQTDDGLRQVVPFRYVRADSDGNGSLFRGPVSVGQVVRRFVQIDPDVAGWTLDIKATQKGAHALPGTTFLLLHDPEGRRIQPYTHYVQIPGHTKHSIHLDRENGLKAGIWEVLLYGHHRGEGPVSVEVTSQTSRYSPTRIGNVERKKDELHFSFSLQSNDAEAKRLSANGQLLGTLVRKTLESKTNVVTHTFTVDQTAHPVEFELDMPEKSWAAVTDVAVLVSEPGSTKTVVTDALGQRIARFRFTPRTKGKYTLKLVLGRTRGNKASLSCELRLKLPYASPRKLTLKGKGLRVPIYPGIERALTFVTPSSVPAPGPDAFYFGRIDFRDRDGRATWHTVYIESPPPE
ncbi:MAG: hypothetical protein CMH54_00215 [Myxococcales bacterium]|nr:hypothetical protein [Myxococcales bacterium]